MKKYFLIFFSAIALLNACNKVETLPSGSSTLPGEPILFSISDNIELKSIVGSASDLVKADYSNAHVYVCGTRDGGEIRDTVAKATSTVRAKVSNYTDKELTYDSSKATWNVDDTLQGIWKYDTLNKRGYEYLFSAYAVSNGISSSHSAHDSTTITNINKTTNSYGKSFTVNHPGFYPSNGSAAFTDYLLSNMCSITSTATADKVARGELVHLHMEHAMAAVRVVIKVNEKLDSVGIKSVKISNFYHKATMQCTSQAGYGSGNTNKWSVTNPSPDTTTYSVGNLNNASEDFDECIYKMGSKSSQQCTPMEFIAIPQDAANATLTIKYVIRETSSSNIHIVTASWQLQNYEGWDYGTRNIYIVTIDTSNQLITTIDDWYEGNSVTGVILP